MKIFIFLFFTLISLAIAKDSKICSCKQYLYKTAPIVTQVSNISDVVLEQFNMKYPNASNILINGLQLNYKGAQNSEYQIDQDKKCYDMKVINGIFEVDGNDFIIDLEMTSTATDLGPENTVCMCKQQNGKDKLDFCNVFLRERIFSRITVLTCILANNEPDYCCSASVQK